MEKKCSKCRFNVRGSKLCRVKDRSIEFERSAPWWRFDRCGIGGRWWQPKIARARKLGEVIQGGAPNGTESKAD